MALIETRWNPTPRDLRWFAALLAVFLCFAGWSIFRRTGEPSLPVGLAAFGLLAGAVGCVRPGAIRWLYVGWMAAVWPIGWCVSHAVMLVVYFVILTPIGLLMRATRRDPMQRRIDHAATSYWTPRPPAPSVDRYFRQS